MQADDFVYTLDSKIDGQTTLEIRVIRGRNLRCFVGHSKVDAFSCKIEVCGSSLTTSSVSGSSPVWEGGPFIFCIHEDPWPLEIGVRLLGVNRSQDKQLNLAMGHMLLQNPDDVKSADSSTMW